jgi:hypothetical protein
MTTFTIDNDNNITAFATPEEAAAATETPFDSFSSLKELAAQTADWPVSRLVELWNSLAGVAPFNGLKPVKKFTDRSTACCRIWQVIQKLAPPAPEATETPNAAPQAPKGAPAKPKPTKGSTAAKKAPKAKKAAKAQDTAGPRAGSKTAQVVAMLQRKNGATLAEIMKAMGWQRHTVRGFMAGAMKKAGYTVESFKPEGGERTYRINS